MDCIQIGAFLRELRREKGLTQEQLAEVLGVSGRTVSRWETGTNMPDLDLLLQIADFHGVEIREILDGGRKSEGMDQEMDRTARMVADYSSEERKKLAKIMCRLFAAGLVFFSVYLVMEFAGWRNTHWLDFIAGVALGFSYGTMIVGLLYASGWLAKFKAWKRRS